MIEEEHQLKKKIKYSNKQVLLNEVEFSASIDEPLIDIILPVYNEAKTIRRVILELHNEIAQKLPTRLIVAEDGSNDGTKEVLKSLKMEVPFLLFSDSRRKGYMKGVSDALKKCNNEWVFFSDSDGQYFSSNFWRLWENRR